MSYADCRTIYILDDDEQYGALLQKLAERSGWRVVNEQSAAIFLDCDFPKSIVLALDLMMPEMDGIEVIRKLIEREIDLTLILISGVDKRTLHSAQVLAEAHNIRVAACVSKPVKLKEFTKILDSINKTYITQRGMILYMCRLQKSLNKQF